MAAPADAASYFKVMAALRSQAPVSSIVGRTIRTCSVPLKRSGDWQYAQFCPIPWLEMSVDQGLDSAARAIFPREYFDWVRGYLREAKKRQPPRSASAAARVYWALDVWSHMQYGLLALNLPLGDPTDRFQRVLGRNQVPKTVASKIFNWASYDSARSFSARGATPRPGPFMLNVESFSRPPQGAKDPSEVWKLVLSSVTPWIAGWGSRWISSKGGKDGSEVSRADAVEMYALLQWRLWSVSDFDNFDRPSVAKSMWPLGMGSRFACATLGQYVAYVARYEPAAPEILTRIENGVTYAYPSFSWVYERWLPEIIDKFSASDYVNILRDHWQWFWDVYGPRVVDGVLVSTKTAHQPLSYTDLHARERGNQAALDAQLAAAVQDPGVLCQRDMPNSKTCVELAAQALKARQLALAATGPFKPLADLGLALLSDAVAAIGAASGGGWPFYAVGNPFARVAAGDKLSTLPSGSTAGLFAKLAAALAQLQIARGFDIVSPPAGVSARDCTVRFTDDGAACTVCVGEPEPPCAKFLPGYVPQPSTAWGEIPFAAECGELWRKWASDNPAVAARLVEVDPDAPIAFYQLCVPVLDGTGSFEASASAWAEFVMARLPSKPSLLQIFFGGFLRASSPVTVG